MTSTYSPRQLPLSPLLYSVYSQYSTAISFYLSRSKSLGPLCSRDKMSSHPLNIGHSLADVVTVSYRLAKVEEGGVGLAFNAADGSPSSCVCFPDDVDFLVVIGRVGRAARSISNGSRILEHDKPADLMYLVFSLPLPFLTLIAFLRFNPSPCHPSNHASSLV